MNHPASGIGRVCTVLGAAALLACPVQTLAGDYESFTISPGFGSRTGTGIPGGPIASGVYGSHCGGYIDNAPDHVIQVSSEVNMTLTVSSDQDSVLVITGPLGVLCDDDSAGNLDAKLSGTFRPGQYQVFVGRIGSGGSGRYTLNIREGQSGGTSSSGAGSADRGLYGNFTLGAGFRPDPQTATGMGGGGAGHVSASTYDPTCSGTIDSTPDHRITITSALNLSLEVSSDFDSTLVVHGPAGTFCDDDSAGNLDARVRARLTPGEYEVYVGAFGDPGQYTLTVTEN